MIKIKKVKWLYVLKEDFTYKLNKTFLVDSYYLDDKDNVWLKILHDGTLIVSKEYAWDGCTPKIKIGNFLFGIWDGRTFEGFPVTYRASLLHDVLYQFRHLGIPLSRREIDKLFLSLMPKFKLKYLYYLAVRIFGSLSAIIRTVKKQNIGKRIDYV